ncbi:hypothetical protein ACFYP4_22410 [Streptomyces sp. NPDC005551]
MRPGAREHRPAGDHRGHTVALLFALALLAQWLRSHRTVGTGTCPQT